MPAAIVEAVSNLERCEVVAYFVHAHGVVDGNPPKPLHSTERWSTLRHFPAQQWLTGGQCLWLYQYEGHAALLGPVWRLSGKLRVEASKVEIGHSAGGLTPVS